MEKKRDSFFLPQRKTHKKEPREKNTEDKQGKGDEKVTEGRVKKPFDKKTYRLKKYSKKYKLEQWEEQRKKKLLRNFYEEIKNDPLTGTYKAANFEVDNKNGDAQFGTGRFVRHPDIVTNEQNLKEDEVDAKKKQDPFFKAKERYKQVKQDKIDRQNEIKMSIEEKRQKFQEYKKKKAERFKKLSRKTKKGQPVMSGRMELLLEKIQTKSK